MVRSFVIASVVMSVLSGAAVASGPAALGSPHDRAGYFTAIRDGRLWVFRKDDRKHIDEFMQNGELGRMVARIGAGPNRMTIRAPDAETIDGYLAAR
ncbi:hypothetical protein FK498_14715 [Elioraea sp. Yellowstone]|jgi:hypothetical protein|uniref:hypothetical protein n=1 Tax=Elioraea sp. Yellowstone TaxID=2592070 RepID=UPI00114E3F99|nr:hypothetical protein [Elioraea sp. Yellowstone]TQF77020.1 hypothetical protein FK498_14715 [Elioraea sp. Yellowstone]